MLIQPSKPAGITLGYIWLGMAFYLPSSLVPRQLSSLPTYFAYYLLPLE